MKRTLARAGTARNALYGVVLTALFLVSPAYAQELTASWYSVSSLKQEGTYAYSHGRMANGKFFRDELATCACNSYPLGSVLRVVNIENGKSVVVVNSDRTAKRFKGKRIDLSKSAMYQIDGIREGLVKVRVEVI